MDSPVRGGALLCRRSPDRGLADHAVRLGISLKSAEIVRGRAALAGSGSPASRAESWRENYLKSHWPIRTALPSYIHDTVVPLSGESHLVSVPAHLTHLTLAPDTRTNLPEMPQLIAPNSGVPRQITTPMHPNPAWSSADHGRLDTAGSVRTWNASRQHSRYEAGQSSRQMTRSLKRTSEICPHRVDQMFFMTGSPLSLRDRYRVDQEEAARLRQLSRLRPRLTSQSRGAQSRSSDAQLPRQPAPSFNMSQGPATEQSVEGATRQEVKSSLSRRSLDEDSVSVLDLNSAREVTTPAREVVTPVHEEAPAADSPMDAPPNDEVAAPDNETPPDNQAAPLDEETMATDDRAPCSGNHTAVMED